MPGGYRGFRSGPALADLTPTPGAGHRSSVTSLGGVAGRFEECLLPSSAEARRDVSRASGPVGTER